MRDSVVGPYGDHPGTWAFSPGQFGDGAALASRLRVSDGVESSEPPEVVMPPRRRLLHSFTAQLEHLLPDVRVTRVRPLALLVLGLLWAGTSSLPRIAAMLPLTATAPSTERRLRRWLANPAVEVGPLWAGVLPTLLAPLAGRELRIVFDPTPHTDRATVLVLGLVVHRRVLPLSWRVLPQHAPWPQPQTLYLEAMIDEVCAALPSDCSVTLLADRGITSVDVGDLCRAVGWHYVLRANAGPHQTDRVLGPDGTERAVWALVTGPGQRWAGWVHLYKTAGWRRVGLTIHWDRHARAPWVLVSDRVPGPPRVRDYRCRMRCEATYEDCKGREFHLDRSKLADLARLDRLLLALAVAYWWAEQLGLRVIRHGQRRRYDRADRRDLSVVRLGRIALQARLDAGRHPPLPFHRHGATWRYAWLA
jgi:hypothetical protein